MKFRKWFAIEICTVSFEHIIMIILGVRCCWERDKLELVGDTELPNTWQSACSLCCSHHIIYCHSCLIDCITVLPRKDYAQSPDHSYFYRIYPNELYLI